MISATGNDVSAEGIVSSVYGVRIENGALRLIEDQALYRDQVAESGSYRPVALHANQTFSIVKSKLPFAYAAKSFGVDSKSFMRTASADRFPAFVAIEQDA
jgi:hypothetical protein